jgi:hypothetical protein
MIHGSYLDSIEKFVFQGCQVSSFQAQRWDASWLTFQWEPTKILFDRGWYRTKIIPTTLEQEIITTILKICVILDVFFHGSGSFYQKSFRFTVHPTLFRSSFMQNFSSSTHFWHFLKKISGFFRKPLKRISKNSKFDYAILYLN